MSNDLRNVDYLEHILNAIDKAQRYVFALGEAKFMARRMLDGLGD